MRSVRHVAVWSATAGLAFGLAACSGSGHSASDAGQPEIGPVATVTDTASLTFPLDRYALGFDKRVVIDNAAAALAGDCMRQFGFKWKDEVQPTPHTTNKRRYGLADAADAAHWGYHPPPAPQDKARSHAASLSVDQTRVYIGTGSSVYRGKPIPEGGCLGQARRALQYNAQVPTFDDRMVNLATQQTRMDARLLSVFGKWSACMKQAGYNYASPLLAGTDPAWEKGTAPSKEEVRTATADVRCKQQANVIGTWYAIEVAYQQRLIAANLNELTAERHMFDTALANAQRVLSTRTPATPQ